MSLSPAFLDELRARTTLSTLLGRTLKLLKSGREWKACCPFHGEKTPSFYVNDDKGFYHCFGCSAHGDAIKWLQDQQGLPFMDAVKELAAAAGLEMPARSAGEDDRDRDREANLEIMARAAQWYVDQLFHPRGKHCREYLGTRGVSGDVAREFKLGFAPPSPGGLELREHLHDVSIERLAQLGLVKVPDDRQPYDFFRGRLMFPIRDARARVIGFGGRAMGDGQPKYLNSPDTPLFDKGRTLFNVDRATAPARRQERLLVVEGYMDVIGLDGAGIGEAVAPNGTAVTEAQLELLWRICPEPTMMFDGDGAGQRAAVKAALRALPLLAVGRSLRFAALPQGKDPDDLAREQGAGAIYALQEASVGVAELLWRHEAAQGRTDEPDGRAALKQRLVEHCQSIRDNALRAAYSEEFKARFEKAFASAPPPARQYQRGGDPKRPWKREQPVQARTRDMARTGPGSQVAGAILAGCMTFPDVVRDHYEQLAGLKVEGRYRELLDAMIDVAIAGVLTGDGMIEDLAKRGFGNAPRALRESTRLPFAFLVPDSGDVGRAALVDAIYAEVGR